MKFCFIMLCLLIAASSASSLTITAAPQNPAGTDIAIGYAENGATPVARARGFALKINAPGANILAVSDFLRRPVRGYCFYPASIALNPAGFVKYYGSPLEPNTPEMPSALGSSQIVVSLCSFYQNNADAPPASGNLLTIRLSKPASVTITPEIMRGGIVNEDAQTMPVAPLVYAPVSGPPAAQPTHTDASSSSVSPCLPPAAHAVASNWLSRTTVADFNADRMCNLKDWALAARSDFIDKGVIWGQTKSQFLVNLQIYMAHARTIQFALPPQSPAARDLDKRLWIWTRILLNNLWFQDSAQPLIPPNAFSLPYALGNISDFTPATFSP